MFERNEVPIMVVGASTVLSSGTSFLKDTYNFTSHSEVAVCVVMMVDLLEDAKEMCLASIDWNKRILGSRAVQRAETVHSLSQSFSSWEGPWEAVMCGWKVVACLNDFWQFRLSSVSSLACDSLSVTLSPPQQSAGCVPLVCSHEPSAMCSSFSPVNSVHWIKVP